MKTDSPLGDGGTYALISTFPNQDKVFKIETFNTEGKIAETILTHDGYTSPSFSDNVFIVDTGSSCEFYDLNLNPLF